MVFSPSEGIEQKINELVKGKRVYWKKHALKRMLERKLKRQEVFDALSSRIIIEKHYLERPLKSYLALGFSSQKPIHIVLAIDSEDDMLWIITAYVPSINEWQSDFKTRRKE